LQKRYSRGNSVMHGKHVFKFMNVADVRGNGRSARIEKWKFTHNFFG